MAAQKVSAADGGSSALERSFLFRLVFGALRLENHPEVSSLVVKRRREELVLKYEELKFARVSGSSCELHLKDSSLRFTYFNKVKLQAFCTELNQSLIDLYRERQLPLIERLLSLRLTYLRDSRVDAVLRDLADFQQRCAQAAKAGISLYRYEHFNAEEQDFLEDLSSLERSAAVPYLRELAEKQLLKAAEPLLDKAEKYPLNPEQRQAVVRTNDRNLILAAAGTGKTSVIVAKALYLMQKGEVKPDELLILAYNTSAAAEIGERLTACAQRLNLDASAIRASTFHALGRGILAECRQRVRLTPMEQDEKARLQWIDTWLYTYLNEKPQHGEQFLHLFLGALSFDEVLKEHTVHSAAAKDAPGEVSPGTVSTPSSAPETYRTLNNEKVKSRQELYIANWLATHGVQYMYEARYVNKVRLQEPFDYAPDFTIIRPQELQQRDPKPPIYLEHFGIERDGSTAPGVDQERYHEIMEQKRRLHQERGTILLETYSYEFTEKLIDQKLTELMHSVDVPLRPMSSQEVIDKIKTNQSYSEIIELLARCLSVIRVYDYSRNHLRSCYAEHGIKDAPAYADFFARLCDDYVKHLRTLGEIDFNDMIIMAAELLDAGKYQPKYRHILVDEFQDISLTRLKLLQSLLKACPTDCALSCVGDDWQAIYHFAGGILDATVHFEKYFGSYTLTKLERTYRYTKSIAAAAGTFVQQNPEQFKKRVISLQQDDEVHVHLLDSVTQGINRVSYLYCQRLRGLKYTHSAVTAAAAALDSVREIAKAHPGASIAVISRYNAVLNSIKGYLKNPALHPANAVLQGLDLSSLPPNDEKLLRSLAFDPNDLAQVKLQLWTMHRAKGLEADYTVLPGLSGGTYLAFPCRMHDSELLEALLDADEAMPDAEERRLFYVALTRARRDAYLIADTSLPVSSFVEELLSPRYQIDVQAPVFQEHLSKIFKCRVCGQGFYQFITGQYGNFYRCSNPACRMRPRVCQLCGAPSIDQENFSECTDPKCGGRLPICARCGRPLVLRQSRYGPFYGCSGFGLRQDACSYKRSVESMERFLKGHNRQQLPPRPRAGAVQAG